MRIYALIALLVVPLFVEAAERKVRVVVRPANTVIVRPAATTVIVR